MLLCLQLICDNYAISPQAEHIRKIIAEANFHEDGEMVRGDL
jgi:hypothetical protein